MTKAIGSAQKTAGKRRGVTTQPVTGAPLRSVPADPWLAFQQQITNALANIARDVTAQERRLGAIDPSDPEEVVCLMKRLQPHLKAFSMEEFGYVIDMWLHSGAGASLARELDLAHPELRRQVQRSEQRASD